MKRMMLVLLLTLIPQAVPAASDNTLFDIQQGLEQRVGEIVKRYDPKALVFVKLVPRIDKEQLPDTPFLIEKYAFDSSGMLSMKRMEVTIMSTSGTVPPSVRKLVHRAVAGFGVNPNILVKSLPEELNPEGEVKKEAISKPSFMDQHEEDIAQVVKIFIGIGATMVVLLLAQLLSQSSQAAKVAQAISGAATTVNTTLENGGKLASKVQPTASERPDVFARGMSLSETSLLALLSDCYWSGEDEYAAFLWKRVPLSKRRGLLAQLPFLGGYAEYVSTLREKDLGLEQTPYYLEPLSLFLFDNDAVTELTRRHPALLNRLPRMRKDHLKLTAMERIRLEEGAARMPVFPTDFSTIAPSPLRHLRITTPIPIRSLAEEGEVMSFDSLTLELKEKVPSLAWLLELTPTEVEEKFKTFSAMELASAWVGPEKVLAELRNRMPRKKVEMLEGYLRTVTPSRNSDTFKSLHYFAIDRLSHKRRLVETVSAPKEEIEAAAAA